MRFICCTCFVIGWLGIVFSASAQTNYSLEGKVLDRSGKAVSKAHVRTQNDTIHAVTNTKGVFKLTNIAAGEYHLVITHVGYQTLQKSILVNQYLDSALVLHLRPHRYEAPSVVVTATRTRRDIEDVPEPVTVISDREIQVSGSTRLSEILAEQTGLTLTSDHGTGIQVQGFDSEYTKIMIDGQPLIGRTAGTFNLDRISVGNVQQVEMIKGPSSALWGSDALASVINIITEKGNRPFELQVNSRYGTNQKTDLGVNLSARQNEWQNNLFFNRNSSEGYSLRSNTISQTVPEYQNYTASYQTKYPLTDHVDIRFQGRYYRETQNSTDYLGDPSDPTLLDGEALQEDYSLSPSIQVELGQNIKADITHYYSRYRTDTKYHYQQGDSLYEHSEFDQHLNKSELQLTKNWNSNHTSSFGSGYKNEQLKGQRYPGDPAFHSYFLYTQHEWMPTSNWNAITGFRYDWHSDYASQFSPKLSSRYKLFDWLHLRASAGSGFKAPDFRQLFLNFTNPTVGYSVFGSSTVREEVRELQENGQIDQILTPFNQLQEIEAEQSWAYNAGIDIYPASSVDIRINFFHNKVNNLIESAPIATKSNGQSIYSYFNLEEVYTQGIETEIRWTPSDQFKLTAGYQLLDARRKIEDTRTVQDEEGEIVEEEFSSYVPMFNRSKHTANIKMYYSWEVFDIDANLQGNWNGKYGRIDTNGNSYVDPNEYEDGYMVWDASLAKTVNERYTLRLGIDNIFDFTRPSDLSYLPGRLFYAKLSLQLY